jgi:hypothetical protein
MNIREDGGFVREGLEGWAVREVADRECLRFRALVFFPFDLGFFSLFFCASLIFLLFLPFPPSPSRALLYELFFCVNGGFVLGLALILGFFLRGFASSGPICARFLTGSGVGLGAMFVTAR